MRCPKTAGPKAEEGCPDTDKDGLRDNQDKGPTAPGLKVELGCLPKPVRDKFNLVIEGIYFPTRKASGPSGLSNRGPAVHSFRALLRQVCPTGFRDAMEFLPTDIAPRNPESCAIQGILRSHLDEFLERVSDDAGGRSLPGLVARELRAIAHCGRRARTPVSSVSTIRSETILALRGYYTESSGAGLSQPRWHRGRRPMGLTAAHPSSTPHSDEVPVPPQPPTHSTPDREPAARYVVCAGQPPTRARFSRG